MIGETISHNACPAALRTTPLNVTMPVSGRLRETLASATSISSVRSSPGRSGASQRNSLTPGEPSEAVRPMIAVEHHPHHDRAKMPARSRQALQHRALRGLFVEMHRLRIELGGKGQYLLARDVARSECAEMAGREIFEGQRHDWGLPEGSPIVAVICGNLNPPTRMARALGRAPPFGARPDLPGTTFGARPCAVPARFRRNSYSTCRENDRCLNFGICFSGTASSRPPSSRPFTGWSSR